MHTDVYRQNPSCPSPSFYFILTPVKNKETFFELLGNDS